MHAFIIPVVIVVPAQIAIMANTMRGLVPAVLVTVSVAFVAALAVAVDASSLQNTVFCGAITATRIAVQRWDVGGRIHHGTLSLDDRRLFQVDKRSKARHNHVA